MKNYSLIATCASGIEAVLGNEMKHLGYDREVENGRVRFEGTIEDIANTNLWLRTADRIKIVIGEFKATTFEQLFDQTEALPWEELLPVNAEFPVSGKSVKSQLSSVPSCQAITKKAIVSRLQKAYKRQGHLPETGAKYPIEVSLVKDQVILTVDTTGSSLFKRGYRTDKGWAPLKENFAAALVLLTSWYPDKPFYDPTTGSGTIAIEAALIGKGIAPGLNRNFQFEDWDITPQDLVKNAKIKARQAIKVDQKLDILAADIDHRMIEIAKENADNAGVLEDIDFKQMQLKDFTTDKINGIIVANPPYGERLSDEEAAHELYKTMGEVYKPLESWSKYILTSDLEFEKHYGEKASKRRKLYNGAIRTDYFQYWGKTIRKPRDANDQ